MARSSACILLLLLVRFLDNALARAEATFTPLGVPDVRDISADGSTVVGYYHSDGSQAYRWTAGEGVVGLGRLPGGSSSVANAVSSDGSVIVGVSSTSASGAQAYRWTAERGMVALDLAQASSNSIAWDVSANGSVIVGSVKLPSFAPYERAFRWTLNNETDLIGPPLPPQFTREWSQAQRVSADGSVVIGEVGSPVEVFRWTSGDGIKLLGDLLTQNPYDNPYSISKYVSPDGSLIVGSAHSANGMEAFRWTANEGMVGLGDFPGGRFDSWAWDVSDDNATVAGSGWKVAALRHACGVTRLEWSICRKCYWPRASRR